MLGFYDEDTERKRGLTWDGKKGRWVQLAYTYRFPRDVFLCPRQPKFSFQPSRNEDIMLNHQNYAIDISVCQKKRPFFDYPESSHLDSEDDAVSTIFEEDPFNLSAGIVDNAPSISWIDDIDIEDFLSSAIDHQNEKEANCQSKRIKSSPDLPSSPPPPLFLNSALGITPLKYRK